MGIAYLRIADMLQAVQTIVVALHLKKERFIGKLQHMLEEQPALMLH